MAKSKVDEILASVEEMTVLELSDLVKKMEEKFGVSAAAPVVMGAGMAAAGEAAEAKDEFDVVLASAGDKKIQVLKVLREVTGLGLKEAKELVDSAPKPIKSGVKKEEAEEIKKKLEGEGAKVEIK
ncbi:50S ribosomal protein L7/L12 [candidate division WOR-1 bacterium DG_54_3]|uniref:Large ribosomal subunit protein bL12 n=1 Tax=candidate division WOR-1 bacterium DG_54_3 TaxID=1703775 RepID=A0A0S7Y3B9_UNCSA|nr:MAG: 50S ribosomal protein L7/L12 [candidate division WOR-1 bacterium DG_54_3]